jgi:hypothetical protein
MASAVASSDGADFEPAKHLHQLSHVRVGDRLVERDPTGWDRGDAG